MKTKADNHTENETRQDSARLAGEFLEAPQYPDECHGLDYHVDEVAGVRIGYVEEINGLRGSLVPEFVPTRFELEVLVEHWLTRIYDNHWAFVGHEMGIAESRENAFANRRLQKLRGLLGDVGFGRVVEKVDSQMEAIHGQDFWLDFRD